MSPIATENLKTTDEFGVGIILQYCDGYLAGKDVAELLTTTAANMTVELVTSVVDRLDKEMKRDAIMYSVLGIVFFFMLLFISYNHLINCCNDQKTIEQRNREIKRQAQFKSYFFNYTY